MQPDHIRDAAKELLELTLTKYGWKTSKTSRQIISFINPNNPVIFSWFYHKGLDKIIGIPTDPKKFRDNSNMVFLGSNKYYKNSYIIIPEPLKHDVISVKLKVGDPDKTYLVATLKKERVKK
jgi:hypothetical protein